MFNKKEAAPSPAVSSEDSSPDSNHKPTSAIQKVIDLFEKHKRMSTQSKPAESDKKAAAPEVKKVE